MEYRDVVDRLAGFHGIPEEDMPTFRARIYILRRAGIPDMPKVGKGSRVEYSLDHITELHLALTLGELGLTPGRIIVLMGMIRSAGHWWPFTKWTDQDWIVVTMRANNGDLATVELGDNIAVAIEHESRVMDRIRTVPGQGVPTWHAVLNLGGVVRNLRSIEAMAGNVPEAAA